MACFVVPASAQSIQWDPVDITLTASGSHSWYSFPVQVTFTHTSGTQLSLDAYWDGGRNWKVRFAPTIAGTWNWRSSSSDSGLNNRSGVVTCTAPTSNNIANNPNFRGHLKVSDNNHYLEYTDGTPFFWLGDTVWAISSERCGIENGAFYTYADNRKAKQFSVAQITYFDRRYYNEGGYPFPNNPALLPYDESRDDFPGNGDWSVINPAYFQSVDTRLEYLFDNGFVIAGPPMWLAREDITLTWAQRIMRYLLARYGAYNTVFALTGEYQYSRDPDKDFSLNYPDEWAQLGYYVQTINPYNNIITIHPTYGGPNYVSGKLFKDYSSSGDFHEDSWLDINWAQTYAWMEDVSEVVYKDYIKSPTKPVIMSEPGYEFFNANPWTGAQYGEVDEYLVRFQAWSALLNGAAGHTYGAWGMWTFYDPNHEQPGEISNNYNDWRNIINAPGASDMQHVSSFFTNSTLNWSALVPHRDWLRVNGGALSWLSWPTRYDFTPPHCAAIAGKTYVVYVPEGNGGNTISITNLASNEYRAQWYNPRTGAYTETSGPNGVTQWNLPSRPNSNDWVLLLTRVDDAPDDITETPPLLNPPMDLVTEPPPHLVRTGQQNNALFQLGLLDVTLYNGWNGNVVDPTGGRDSTLAIQKAAYDARDYNLALFFPHQSSGNRGIYLISKTIDLRMRHPWPGDNVRSHKLIGSTKGDQCPLIKLAPNAADFQNLDSPQPMLWFWSQAPDIDEPPIPAQVNTNNPLDNDTDISYYQTIRNLDFDLGGNRAAIGIKNPGAQGQLIQNVVINATGALAGIGNVTGLGSSETDITVIGGQYGIFLNTVTPKRTYSPYGGAGLFTGCTFINQDVAAVRITWAQGKPIVFIGVHVKNNKAIPFNDGNVTNGRSGGLMIIDGVIDISGGTLIDKDNAPVYMRNVYTKGVNRISDDFPITNTSQWTWVKEYSFLLPNEHKSVINGTVLTADIKDKQEGLIYTEDQLIKSLVDIHRFDRFEMPSFEDTDIINVKDLGAKGDGVSDDSNVLEQAIARGIQENKKVFLPKGRYGISRTLQLKANSKVFGVCNQISQIAPVSSWRPNIDGSTFLIDTEDDPNGTAILSNFLVGSCRLSQHYFSNINWRVGRNSLIHNVFSDAIYKVVGGAPYVNGIRYKVSGSGGGRFFGINTRIGTAVVENQKNIRGILVEGTTEPLRIYGGSVCTGKEINIEVINSRNVTIYRSEFEQGNTVLKVTNSDNVALFAYYKNNHTTPDGWSTVEFRNSNNCLTAMNGMNYNSLGSLSSLLEEYNGETIRLEGERLHLYKRGEFPYTPILEDTPDEYPILNITKPTSSIHQTNLAYVEIEGTALDDNPGYSITWENNRGGSGSITVDANNNWEVNVPLQIGDNIIAIKITDSTGQEAVKTIRAIYSILPVHQSYELYNKELLLPDDIKQKINAFMEANSLEKITFEK